MMCLGELMDIKLSLIYSCASGARDLTGAGVSSTGAVVSY